MSAAQIDANQPRGGSSTPDSSAGVAQSRGMYGCGGAVSGAPSPNPSLRGRGAAAPSPGPSLGGRGVRSRCLKRCALAAALALAAGCPRGESLPVPGDNQSNSHAAPGPASPDSPDPAAASPPTAAEAPRLDPPVAEARPTPGQWFFVEAARPGARGGWGTADFDRQRNRLNIDLHDVTRFRIDTSRIAIDWDRLVLLNIDGSTSELRQRDVTQYRFVRDESGGWTVVEP